MGKKYIKFEGKKYIVHNPPTVEAFFYPRNPEERLPDIENLISGECLRTEVISADGDDQDLLDYFENLKESGLGSNGDYDFKIEQEKHCKILYVLRRN